MGMKELQKDIRNGQGFIMSDGTCNIKHLLPKAYDLIIDYNIRSAFPLAKEIAKVINLKDGSPSAWTEQYHGRTHIKDEDMETAEYIWNEDIYDLFNEIAPKGYYFGGSEGDGACIGWFVWEFEEVNL